ncbi:hypothetical protein C2S52_011635 [Perilla frutescens var. hirtella]|nr:hypothetical protein C2S52_011635 [Perilla frutescens var. hirtella]
MLQMILEGAQNRNLSPDAIEKFAIDNCKSIYFAGFETTAIAASWCLMLLASNPEWQHRLTMVINESLRLYPPVSVVAREAVKELKFTNARIPKDPDIWGPDSYQFKPQRFANGTTGACKLPHLFTPFGFGPRLCLGLNLAMAELKILVALILSNFHLSLSPKYVHAPVMNLVLEPGSGVDLLIQKLKIR